MFACWTESCSCDPSPCAYSSVDTKRHVMGRFKDNTQPLHFNTWGNNQCFCGLPYLSKPHAVPLVGGLLRLGRVHQLEARLVLLMKVGVLTTASKLRGILIWRKYIYMRNQLLFFLTSEVKDTLLKVRWRYIWRDSSFTHLCIFCLDKWLQSSQQPDREKCIVRKLKTTCFLEWNTFFYVKKLTFPRRSPLLKGW